MELFEFFSSRTPFHGWPGKGKSTTTCINDPVNQGNMPATVLMDMPASVVFVSTATVCCITVIMALREFRFHQTANAFVNPAIVVIFRPHTRIH